MKKVILVGIALVVGLLIGYAFAPPRPASADGSVVYEVTSETPLPGDQKGWEPFAATQNTKDSNVTIWWRRKK